MSLDLVMRKADGQAHRLVPIPLQLYPSLLAAGRAIAADQLDRLSDYYQEVVFEPAEVETLEEELRRLVDLPPDVELEQLLQDLLSLAREAIELGLPLRAIPD